jgi:hypothetical protein
MEQNAREEQQSMNKKLYVPIIIASIVLGLTGCAGEHEADIQKCEGKVKNTLQSPTTAQFSGVTTTKHDFGVWTIEGNVDAQNGFGAMIRDTFSCVVDKNGVNLGYYDPLLAPFNQ